MPHININFNYLHLYVKSFNIFIGIYNVLKFLKNILKESVFRQTTAETPYLFRERLLKIANLFLYAINTISIISFFFILSLPIALSTLALPFSLSLSSSRMKDHAIRPDRDNARNRNIDTRIVRIDA